jgi:hypothetical protein
MRRVLAATIGVLEIVAARRIIDWGERLAFETPDTGRLRLWTIPIARLEGLVFAWLLGRKASPPAGGEKVLAIGGFVLALFPRTVVELALKLAYENADELEVRGWVVPTTRLLGACYVVIGLFSKPVGEPTDATVE